MICEHTSTGCPDCGDRDCRTRWLVGSTTGQPFSPAPIPTLILDVLETWRGGWLTDGEVLGHVLRIRPELEAETAARQIRWIAYCGGGKWEADPALDNGEWVDHRGRLHAQSGRYAPMPHRWMTVECREASSSGLLLRVP